MMRYSPIAVFMYDVELIGRPCAESRRPRTTGLADRDPARELIDNARRQTATGNIRSSVDSGYFDGVLTLINSLP